MTKLLPSAVVALTLPAANGKILMFVLPAAPPPPMSVPGEAVDVISATPAPAVLPRLVPRTKSVELFCRVMLEKLRLAACAALGVTVIVLTPLVRLSAPATSFVAAVAFPVMAIVAPRSVMVPLS